jgi:hypothetical protein
LLVSRLPTLASSLPWLVPHPPSLVSWPCSARPPMSLLMRRNSWVPGPILARVPARECPRASKHASEGSEHASEGSEHASEGSEHAPEAIVPRDARAVPQGWKCGLGSINTILTIIRDTVEFLSGCRAMSIFAGFPRSQAADWDHLAKVIMSDQATSERNTNPPAAPPRPRTLTLTRRRRQELPQTRQQTTGAAGGLGQMSALMRARSFISTGVSDRNGS